MQKYTTVKRLCDINTNSHVIQWTKEFLTDGPQRVRCSEITSDTVNLNTGAPRSCVLSPVLFSLNTNEMQIMNSTRQIYLYADDSVLFINESKTKEDGYCESPQCLSLLF